MIRTRRSKRDETSTAQLLAESRRLRADLQATAKLLDTFADKLLRQIERLNTDAPPAPESET